MTRPELKAAQLKARSHVAALYILPFAAWATSIAVYCHFEHFLMERLSPTVHWALILGVLLGWVVVFLPVHCLAGRIQRRHGLNCPECGAKLVGTPGMIVMATGKCGHCGRQVIDVDAQPSGSAALHAP